jgi:hypothetical protein
MYEEFTNPDNGFLYVWVEGPVQMLDMEIPSEAANSKRADGTQKTPRDYLTLEPMISKDGKTAIILLNEMLEPRRIGVVEENIAKWDTFLAPLGLGYATGSWMGLDQSTCENKVSKRIAEAYSDEDAL